VNDELKNLFEQALLDAGHGRRFTQDSPILPDVWMAYFTQPLERIDLLLTPHWGNDSGRVARSLARRVREQRRDDETIWKKPEGETTDSPRIAYTNSTVAAALRFGELIRAVLPMTRWWEVYVWTSVVEGAWGIDKLLEDPDVRLYLVERLVEPGLLEMSDPGTSPALTPEVLWMTRLVGLIALEARHQRRRAEGRQPAGDEEDAGSPEVRDFLKGEAPAERRREIAADMIAETARLVAGLDAALDDPPMVFSVNRNRPATTAVFDSHLAVKADAARLLFGISCRDLSWAVIDSGIDATHPAFARRNPMTGAVETRPDDRRLGGFRFDTRVKATYDFSLVRYLLAPDTEALEERLAELRRELAEGAGGEPLPVLAQIHSLERLRGLVDPGSKALDERIAELEAEVEEPEEGEDRTSPADRRLHRELEGLREVRSWLEARRKRERQERGIGARERKRRAKDLQRSLERGRAIDWAQIAEFLELPHDEGYRRPRHNHGTHVAGILGGDWRGTDPEPCSTVEGDLVGVAPDIHFYDLRVLGDDGSGDEFAVIAALQFARYLNEQSEATVLHGANLSLSIRHAVANYACGRTPVCDESERLVGSGVVVVAAAGNRGFQKLLTSEYAVSEGYAAISITDPGNTEGVITVGATHRSSPHTYGVSYFSSRGPTGDGRSKPDLVAPGEKITAPIPGGRYARLDGTSMAAPHVSGVAALLMARHWELVGQPARIKRVLLDTATDLGRERYFQGAGMVDALRALQSV
jgi:serine protease AprX